MEEERLVHGQRHAQMQIVAVAREILVRVYAYGYIHLLVVYLGLTSTHEVRTGITTAAAQGNACLQLDSFEHAGGEVDGDGRVLGLHAAAAASVANM
jgi:hypothetical protein